MEKLVDWPGALAGMRVCWNAPRQTANCGVCYKCLYVRTLFKVLGIEECTAFDQPLDEARVRDVDFAKGSDLLNWERLLTRAETTLRGSPWLETIRAAVERGRRKFAGPADSCGRSHRLPDALGFLLIFKSRFP